MAFKTADDFRKHLESTLFSLNPNVPTDAIEKKNILTAIDILVKQAFPKIEPVKLIPPPRDLTLKNKNKTKKSKKNVQVSEIENKFVSRKPTRPPRYDPVPRNSEKSINPEPIEKINLPQPSVSFIDFYDDLANVEINQTQLEIAQNEFLTEINNEPSVLELQPNDHILQEPLQPLSDISLLLADDLRLSEDDNENVPPQDQIIDTTLVDQLWEELEQCADCALTVVNSVNTSNLKAQKNISLSVNPVVAESSQPRIDLSVNNVNDTHTNGPWPYAKKEIKMTEKPKKERTLKLGTIFPFKLEIFTKPKIKKTVKPKIQPTPKQVTVPKIDNPKTPTPQTRPPTLTPQTRTPQMTTPRSTPPTLTPQTVPKIVDPELDQNKKAILQKIFAQKPSPQPQPQPSTSKIIENEIIKPTTPPEPEPSTSKITENKIMKQFLSRRKTTKIADPQIDSVKNKILKKIFPPKNTKKPNKIFCDNREIFGGGGINNIFPIHADLIEPPRDRFTLHYIDIKTIGRRYMKKFSNHINDYKINFKKQLPKMANDDLITKALTEMINYGKYQTNWKKGDKMNIVVENQKFFYPISTGYQCDDMVTKLKNKIQQILTSNQTVVLTDCRFTLHVINMPRGAGRTKIINLNVDKHTKKCITQIQNKDNLCAIRAMLVGKSYKTKFILDRELSENEIIYLRKGREIQTELALSVCMQLEDYDGDPLTIEDIGFCEDILDIQVKIVCAENFNNIIYKGRAERPVKIYLYKQGNHFDVIKKMGPFYGSVYYCDKCDKPYKNKDQHRCRGKKGKVCPLCMKGIHAVEDKNKIYCNNCNRYCYNNTCFRDHSLVVCPAVFKCSKCSKLIRRDSFSTHKCGFTKCFNCLEIVKTGNHQCYMLSKNPKGGKCGSCKNCDVKGVVENKNCTYTEKYIFFDYEAQQETGVHRPNLVIAHGFFGEKFIFDTNEEFCEWLISREHKGYTAIAHYARGYDSQFILQYCIANTVKPYTIYSGTKLMMLEVPSIGLKIIDSHNFVQAPLSTFPKTFGLTELKKGYFPHLFNTEANENYVGPIPDKKYYCYDTMKEDERKKFIEWHSKKVEEGYIFDMAKELVEYCDSDVDILRRGCLIMRKDFLEIGNIDPFQYVTIPSVCMANFRAKYLTPKTIAILEEQHVDRYSKQSLSWLVSLDNPNIRHALNGGEVEYCGARVDGYDETTNTVYQYHGCFWHGCPRCFKPYFINNIKKETMEDLYQKTVDRTKQLEGGGYTVVEMWECRWVKTKEYKKYVKTVEVVEPLNPREALFGGRTEVFKLKQLTKNLGYGDVCSLYPTVMFYDYYPIGHPFKMYNPEKYDSKWFGFIKCKILPPQNLYLPILPVKVKMEKAEKLVFPLCLKCAENRQQRCDHTTEERQFTGTWTTVEVNKAIENGYKIVKIYEVWHFEKSKDLWKGYVSDFMKIKLETSPHNYPSNEAYAKEIKEKMGIELDVNNIKPNPGKRAVSKLCLNSLWGKFGQRQNMSQTEFINDAYRFYEILLDNKLEDITVMYVSEEMVQVNYRYRDTYVKNNFNTNIFVAAYTTANARLRLYEQLSRLDKNVVYCDTDSIVYIKDGKTELPFGDMLGEWTDELNGGYITKWLATGPKSYYYETNTGKSATKVKGFTLHHKNALKINGDAMEKLIDGVIPNVTVENKEITRDPETKQLVNKDQTKTFSFGFDKRVIMTNFDTVPYGYIEDADYYLNYLQVNL